MDATIHTLVSARAHFTSVERFAAAPGIWKFAATGRGKILPLVDRIAECKLNNTEKFCTNRSCSAIRIR
jgi:hypothetical protein